MIRRFTLLLILITLVSCDNNDKTSFQGLGEFKIGVKFDSIPSSGLFDKINDNEFRLNKFEISKEIGFVEDLIVKVENGEIYEVEFSSGEYTDNFIIDQKLKNGAKESYNSDDGGMEYTSYKSNNGKVEISRMELKDETLAVLNGFFQNLYKYSDSKISMEKANIEERIKDSIEKAEYMKDVRQ